MSAAAERAALAAIGRDLTEAQGGAGTRRAAMLTRPPGDPPPAAFDLLNQAPEWLRFSPERQTRLAQLVALRSIAPALAASIDGAWLGTLAALVGEPALDWAIAGASAADGPSDATLAPADLAPTGFSMLAAHLPPELRAYLAAAPLVGGTRDDAALGEALRFLREHDG